MRFWTSRVKEHVFLFLEIKTTKVVNPSGEIRKSHRFNSKMLKIIQNLEKLVSENIDLGIP